MEFNRSAMKMISISFKSFQDMLFPGIYQRQRLYCLTLFSAKIRYLPIKLTSMDTITYLKSIPFLKVSSFTVLFRMSPLLSQININMFLLIFF